MTGANVRQRPVALKGEKDQVKKTWMASLVMAALSFKSSVGMGERKGREHKAGGSRDETPEFHCKPQLYGEIALESESEEDEDEEEEEEDCSRSEDELGMREGVEPSSPVLEGSGSWTWQNYLQEQHALSAPLHLFKECQRFPQGKNLFQPGMRLEGPEPQNPAVFTILCVRQVCGFRVLLCADGRPSRRAFWRNADAPELRPAGWCQLAGRILMTPKGYSERAFCWESYLQACGGAAAPRHVFRHFAMGPEGVFQPGMRLEALDRQNPALVCVATITDVLGWRLLIHFDGWDPAYDYWCDDDSPYIFPVGWCHQHGKPLTPPQDHPEGKPFCWKRYLQEHGAIAAPSNAFSTPFPSAFSRGMKLEVVDQHDPSLIRVATVLGFSAHRVRVSHDGCMSGSEAWHEVDSPDLHPAGWCQFTGHPLQHPVRSTSNIDRLATGATSPHSPAGVPSNESIRRDYHTFVTRSSLGRQMLLNCNGIRI
uniref:L3MBTL histone methyl-lysine binding protein 4 n=1 Tax=Eptatretus burgeri TaxID=7764 RepID=A0A8C4N6G5_EPTBU